MYIHFKDINGSEIVLAKAAVWAITIPAAEDQLAEVLLARAEKSIKITRDVAAGLKECFV
jgi:hypothetical protein